MASTNVIGAISSVEQEEKDLAVWLVGESAEFLVRNVRNSIVAAAREGRLNDESTRRNQRGVRFVARRLKDSSRV